MILYCFCPCLGAGDFFPSPPPYLWCYFFFPLNKKKFRVSPWIGGVVLLLLNHIFILSPSASPRKNFLTNLFPGVKLQSYTNSAKLTLYVSPSNLRIIKYCSIKAYVDRVLTNFETHLNYKFCKPPLSLTVRHRSLAVQGLRVLTSLEAHRSVKIYASPVLMCYYLHSAYTESIRYRPLNPLLCSVLTIKFGTKTYITNTVPISNYTIKKRICLAGCLAFGLRKYTLFLAWLIHLLASFRTHKYRCTHPSTSPPHPGGVHFSISVMSSQRVSVTIFISHGPPFSMGFFVITYPTRLPSLSVSANWCRPNLFIFFHCRQLKTFTVGYYRE